MCTISYCVHYTESLCSRSKRTGFVGTWPIPGSCILTHHMPASHGHVGDPTRFVTAAMDPGTRVRDVTNTEKGELVKRESHAAAPLTHSLGTVHFAGVACDQYRYDVDGNAVGASETLSFEKLIRLGPPCNDISLCGTRPGVRVRAHPT